MRYRDDDQVRSGTALGTAKTVARLRRARDLGRIPYREEVLKGDQRLDHIAGKFLKDGRLWWVIAALSNIGWGMQVPAGTLIKIPTDIPRLMEHI